MGVYSHFEIGAKRGGGGAVYVHFGVGAKWGGTVFILG